MSRFPSLPSSTFSPFTLAAIAIVTFALPAQTRAQDEPAAGTSSDAPTPGAAEGDESEAASPEAASPEDGDDAGPTTRRVVDEQADSLDREQRAAEQVLLVDERASEEERNGTNDRDHEYQVGLRVTASHLFVLGISYGESPRCDAPRVSTNDDDVFCARVEEPALDFELNFSFSSRLAVTAFFQYGLLAAEHTNGNASSFGLGLRTFTNDDGLVKGFLGVRALVHYANSNVPTYVDGYPEWDFGLRGEGGIQVDPIRWLGLYATGAVSVRLVKGFYFFPEIGGGVEFRVP